MSIKNKQQRQYRRDRPSTSIGIGKIESLITTLSNIENTSNFKTLSNSITVADWILNDNDNDDQSHRQLIQQVVRPLVNSSIYNIQHNRPVTALKPRCIHDDNIYRPQTSHFNKTNNENNRSISSKEDELSSKLIDEILVTKENHPNELPKYLKQFKNDLINAKNTLVQLPVLGILSPGHKKQASYLPPPDEVEQMKLIEYEKKVKNIDKNELYKSLGQEIDTNIYYGNKIIDDSQYHHDRDHPSHTNKLAIMDPYSQRYYNSTARYLKRQDDRKIKENSYISKYATDGNIEKNCTKNKLKRSQTAKRVAPNPILSPIRNISTAPARTPNSSVLLKTELPNHFSFADLFHQIETTDPVLKNSQEQSKALNLNNVDLNLHSNDVSVPEVFKNFENNASLNNVIDSAYDDLGIDLNPLYNKKRYFGKSFMLLLYYYNFFRQKQGFIFLYEQAKKVTANRERNSCILLVRVGRGMLGRLKCKAIRDILKRQAAVNADYQRQLALYYDKNASIITRAIFIYVKAKIMERLLRQKRSVICIQKIARGHLIRNKFALEFEMKTKQRKFSITIQKAYRLRLAKRRVLILKKIRNVTLKNIGMANTLDERNKHLQRHGAAFTIQRYNTAYKIRKRLKSILFWHHDHLITVTQARFRGFAVRKWYKRTIRLKKNKFYKQNNASTTIQKVYRGFCTRKIYKVLMIEKNQMLHEKILAKKEKMKANYFKINFLDKDYKINPFKIIRTILRKSMPLRYMYEEPYAIIIQKAWRRHCATKRAFTLKVSKSISEMENRNRAKHRAAVMVQALLKGYLFRSNEMRKARIKMCIRIQCFVRYKQANRRIHRIRARAEATIMLRRNLIIVLQARKLQKIRTIKKLYDKKSRVIQRLIRNYLGKKGFLYLKSSIRAKHEFLSMARFHIDCLIGMVQLKILRESLQRDIGSQSHNFCGANCIGSGPIQALFLSMLGDRAMYGEKELTTNKLDLQTLTKFSNRINDAAVMIANKQDKFLKIGNQQPLLLQLLEKRSLELPPLIVKKLSTIDVSVAMSSAKTDGNTLSYLDFVDWLSRIGIVFFKDVKRTKKISLLGATATQEPLKKVTKISKTNEALEKLEENIKPVPTTKHCDIRTSLIVTFEDFKEDLELACAVRILSLLSMHSEFMTIPKVLEWLDNESMSRLGVFVIRLQSMYRLWKGRRVMEQRIIEREQALAYLVFHKAGTIINKWIRRFLSKHKVARRAQQVYRRLFPCNTPGYWHNPRTTRTFQSKPPILMKYECLHVPIPETRFEFIVACIFCSQKAQVNCNGCEESYCFSCFKNLHCKGKKSNHHFTYIPTCSNCKFQNATKNCLTCIIQRPKPNDVGVERDVPKADKGLYCDCCFTHIHDQLQQVNDANHPIAKFRHYNLLKSTNEGYLKQGNLRRKILSEHKYDNLVEPCEECNFMSASWRCTECNQLYCHGCLFDIHTSGVFKKHKAERLSYFTIEMAKNYRTQEAIFRTQTKFNKLKKEEARKRERFYLESIVRIQTWYRKSYWGRKGRRQMKALRTKMRRDYKYRKKETLKKRSKFFYKVLDFFSQAPKLFSDTKEERIMKRINVLWRQQIKEVIWKNQTDWGFYQHLNPRKGVPKRGFEIGTIEELIDQAQNGGYRLPGLIDMKQTLKIHRTTTSLVDILKPGEIIRVRDQLIRVVKVGDDGLEFASRWRYKSSPIDGEIFYRMPCDKSTFYKLKFYYQQFKQSKLATNTYWFSYAKLLSICERFCNQLAEPDEKDGRRDKDQLSWFKKAKYYQRKILWAESFIISDDGVPKPKTTAVDEGFDEDLDELSTEKNLEPYIKDLLLILRSETRGGQSEIESEKTISLLKARKPNTEWYATPIEILMEQQRISKISNEDLIAEAKDWETLYDSFAGKKYYFNKVTKQRMVLEPPQILARKDQEADQLKKQKTFEDTKLAVSRSKAAVASSTKSLGGKKFLKR